MRVTVRGGAVDASPRLRLGRDEYGLYALALAVAALAVVRLALAAHTPVIDDEAYYWIWSRHPGLSYLDHPPLVAWLDAAAAHGRRAEWLLRLPAVAAAVAATGALYFLGRDLFGRAAGLRAAALYLSIPVFALQAIHAIPDPLLYLWWSAATWTFWRAARGPSGAIGYWAAAGAALGLGLLAKYTMLLWLPAPLVLLALPRYRGVWRTPGPYLAAAVAAALALPVVVWNAAHGWASVRFWLDPGAAGGPPGGGGLGNILSQAAVQFGYGGPLTFPLMAWAVWRTVRLGRRDDRFAYLALAAAPTAAAVVLADLFGVYRPNWLAPAFLAGAVTAAAFWPPRLGPAAVASGLALSLAATALVPLAPRLPSAIRWDELYGWREVTDEMVRRAAAFAGAGPVVLLGQRYNQAAYFGYYADERVPATTRRFSEFSFIAPAHRFVGWQGLAALDAREPLGDLARDCRRLEETAPYSVPFPGGGARRFRIWRCIGYLGTPAPP